MSIAQSGTAPLDVLVERTTARADGTPHHLVRLPGTNWNLWRTVVLRGTGFPAAMAEELAAPQAAAAADHYLACRTRATRDTDAAVRRLDGELRGTPDFRRKLRAFRAAIVAGKVQELSDQPAGVAAAEACARMERAREAFLAAYGADEQAINKRLVAFSCEPRFREAMLWQAAGPTRRIWHDLRPETDAKSLRKALRQVAMRVQRYALKNDSIGFFGPVGWGMIEEDESRIAVTSGPGLLANREVFFEGWSIDALAACLDTEELKPWIAPRVKAGVWIHGSCAYRSQRKEFTLSEEERAVLAQCDGNTTAKDVAQAVLKQGRLSAGAQEKEVFAVLERLETAGLIAWRLEVASQLHPERELAKRLERIGDAELRVRCTSALHELVEARDRVAMAAGSAAELDKQLQGLDETFTRLTAQPSSRRGGQTYGGRTLVYEDCRRDCEVQIGTKLLEDMAQPLGIVLDAARWALAEVGRVMNQQLRICLSELLELKDDSQDGIDSHLFVEYVTSKLYVEQGRSTTFDPIEGQYREMWKHVLGRPSQSSSNRVVFPAQEAFARATDIFPAREIGFSLGRYVSPDLMIAAASVDAIRRGDYIGVLGEVHCENTLASSCFVAQHPDPRRLCQAVSSDTIHDTVVSQQRPTSVWLARTNDALTQPHHWRYLFGDDPPHHPLCRALPAGMLRVIDTGSSVAVRGRDGSIQFDALELFGTRVVDEAERLLGEFLPVLPHTPRTSLGKLVISRECWNVARKDMPFFREKDPAQQFLDMRVWGRASGMPRRVFVKSPAERKPWFLDFNSPVLMAIFSSLVRKLPEDAQVRFVEMFPDLNDLWLVDRDGLRFTGELRLVARAVPESSN